MIIVGSGLMGTAVARGLRDADPTLDLLMIEGGPRIGSVGGQHLHDVTEPEIWAQYNRRVASGIQGYYTGTTPTPPIGPSMVGITPGMYHLSSYGQHADAMSSAALSWNVGGMGVHWTAGTPLPWGVEINPCVPEQEWRDDLARAGQLLRTNPDPYGVSPAGGAVLDVLGELFGPDSAEGRTPRPMPMALNPDGAGDLRRTGPNTIFSPLADPKRDAHFTLLAGSLAVAVQHEGGRAVGVRVRDVATGTEQVVSGGAVVVCGDTLRTPQLLFASDIRPAALGRYLNEHVTLAGRVIADPDRLGFTLADLTSPKDEEWTADALWLPHCAPESLDDARPFQFQLMNTVAVDDDHRPIAYSVGLGTYVATDVRAENRIEFAADETDSAGLPRMRIHFDYTDADEARVRDGQAAQRRLAERLGDFDPATESERMSAGSSLHFTGSVRMGRTDDGTSVCDPNCRVWGFDNLYVAGNGVLPTSLVCNSTLTGMTTAVRTARAVLAG